MSGMDDMGFGVFKSLMKGCAVWLLVLILLAAAVYLVIK